MIISKAAHPNGASTTTINELQPINEIKTREEETKTVYALKSCKHNETKFNRGHQSIAYIGSKLESNQQNIKKFDLTNINN